MTFAEKLRDARIAMGLSQIELGEKSGLTERAIYNYEQGIRYPKLSIIYRLAAALNVSATYLTNEEETDTQKYFEHEQFISLAREKFGHRGARGAQQIIDQASVLFAGGELDEESKDLVFEALTEVYFHSKAKASEKFTPESKKKRVD